MRVRSAIVGTAAFVCATAAFATIPGTDHVIHGCYSKSEGALRVVEDASACHADETALALNQTGPAGPAGPTGPSGATAGGFPASAETTFAVLTKPGENADLLASLPLIPPVETRCLVTIRGYLDTDGGALSSSIVPIQLVDGTAQLISVTQVRSDSPQSLGKSSLSMSLSPLGHGAYAGQLTAVVRYTARQSVRFGCRLSTLAGAAAPGLLRCDVSYLCQ